MTSPGNRPPGSRIIPRRPMTAEQESLEAGHELRDMRVRQVIRWLLLLAIAVTTVVTLVTVFAASRTGGIGELRFAIGVPPRATPPPEPRLEAVNGETLRVLRAQEDRALNNFTWIDQAAGVVGLPIDRAIELTLERGLPVRPQEGGNSVQGGPAMTLPQGSNSGRTPETNP